MTVIGFTVYGKSEPAGSKTAYVRGNRAIVTDANKKSKPWKGVVAKTAAEARAERGIPLMTGPVSLDVVFIRARPKGHYGTGRNAATIKPSAPEHPTTKPDATKLLRGVEDALTGILWQDDAQIVVQHVRKEYGDPERCEIFAREIEPATGVQAVRPLVERAA